jgi:tRNA-specific 2-thiouridylase
MYVKNKNIEKNLLIIGKKVELYSTKFVVSNLNFLQDIPENAFGYVKVRKKFKEVPCKIFIENDKMFVESLEPIFAITPGQIAVVYDSEGAVMVSGEIDKEGWN